MNVTRREALLKEYGEVGSNFRLLTDIRFKLLAFLPIAAAAAAALKGNGSDTGTFCLSLFGLAATLGVATYNARNDQLYDELVGRAASIERSLGLPDGAFANRPRPWLKVQLGCGFTWSIDHRTGVTIIYAASIALWVYGIIAPTLQYARHIYFPFALTTNQDIVVNLIAIIVAIGLTVLGSFIFTKQKKAQAQALREWAIEAVTAAAGLSMSKVGERTTYFAVCETLP